MERGLRQRASSKNVVAPPKSAPPELSSKDESKLASISSRKSRRSRVFFVSLLLHGVAVVIFVYGWVLGQQQLYHGGECTMTYSQRRFLEVETSFVHPSQATRNYRLYKFVDQRDPRYQPLLRQQEPLVEQHCTVSNATIVLYIPGHWGSYGQARSVGAHGTQMTGPYGDTRAAQRHLRSPPKWHGKSDNLDNFVYEVYAVSFAEQGGALHGRILELQSDFVSHVVQQLKEACQVETITIVAHSMGGYVARLAPIRHPHIQEWMPHVITLATPHSNPLYAMDRSIAEIHQQIVDATDTASSRNAVTVSISGGLRDEMIDPQACGLPKSETTLSYSSTRFLDKSKDTLLLGMDHRAIVWCHALLDHVRQVIWVLAQPSNDKIQHITEVLGEANYEKDLHQLSSSFESLFGHWVAISLESARLYRLPEAYILYILIGGLRCALPHYLDSLMIPLATFAVMGIFLGNPTTSILSSLILTLVASALNRLLIAGLSVWARKQTKDTLQVPWRLGTGLALVLLAMGGALVFWIEDLAWSWDLLGCLLYMYGIGMVLLQSLSSCVAFGALVVLAIPGMFAGSLVLMMYERAVTQSSWVLWMSLLLPIRLASGRANATQFHHFILLLLSVLVHVPWLAAPGMAYRVDYLVATLAMAKIWIHWIEPQLFPRGN